MNSLRRVLVVQPYGIGDLLFLTPVLRALRLVPTVETVDLLLGSRTEAVVQTNPHVDEITCIDKDLFHKQGNLKNFSDLIKLGAKLRKKKYDLLLDYSLRGEYAFFSQFFLGIPRRAGFNFKRRGFFHNLRLPIPQGFNGKPVADFFCDLAEKAGIVVEDRFLEFYPADADKILADRLLSDFYASLTLPPPISSPIEWGRIKVGGESKRRFLVLSLGGGESWGKDANFKRWPVTFFAEFTKRLKEFSDFETVIIVGSAQEKSLGDSFQKMVGIKTLNLAGQISLGVTASLIEKAGLFIGNDGGLVHLAHALHTHVIAFYGPVDPVVYGPYPESENAISIFKKDLECRPCYQKFRYNAACAHKNCLQALTPEEALNMIQEKSFFPLTLPPSPYGRGKGEGL